MSRELDVQVARAVGLNVVSEDWPCEIDCDYGDLVPRNPVELSDGRWVARLNSPGDERHPVYGTPPRVYGFPHWNEYTADVEIVPFYSTDWAEAGRLWAWLEARGTGLQLQQTRPGQYCATMCDPTTGGIFAQQGATPPEALARLVVRAGKAGLKPVAEGNQ